MKASSVAHVDGLWEKKLTSGCGMACCPCTAYAWNIKTQLSGLFCDWLTLQDTLIKYWSYMVDADSEPFQMLGCESCPKTPHVWVRRNLAMSINLKWREYLNFFNKWGNKQEVHVKEKRERGHQPLRDGAQLLKYPIFNEEKRRFGFEAICLNRETLSTNWYKSSRRLFKKGAKLVMIEAPVLNCINSSVFLINWPLSACYNIGQSAQTCLASEVLYIPVRQQRWPGILKAWVCRG